MFFVILAVQTSFFSFRRTEFVGCVEILFAHRLQITLVFDPLANPSVSNVSYRRKGFSSSDWTASKLSPLVVIFLQCVIPFTRFHYVISLRLHFSFFGSKTIELSSY